MKRLVLFISFVIQTSYVVPASIATTSTDITKNLSALQATANALHEEVEENIHVFRTEYYNTVEAEAIQFSLNNINHEINSTHAIQEKLLVDLWLSKSNVCYNLLLPRVLESYAKVGKEFGICASLYDTDLSNAARSFLDELTLHQTHSQAFQTIIFDHMVDSNMFSNPDEMIARIENDITNYKNNFESIAATSLREKLMTFKITLREANTNYNFCLQLNEIQFKLTADEIKKALQDCVAVVSAGNLELNAATFNETTALDTRTTTTGISTTTELCTSTPLGRTTAYTPPNPETRTTYPSTSHTSDISTSFPTKSSIHDTHKTIEEPTPSA